MIRARFVHYAPDAARYLLLTLADGLPKARRLVMSLPLVGTDEGEGGDYTVAINGATSSARGVIKLLGQLGGTADAPDVRGLRTTSGSGTLLGMGAVADGQVLQRSGTSLVGADVVPAGGGTMSGDLAMGGHKVTGLATGTATGDAATYGQVASMVNGLDWQQSVLDKDLATPPGSPATGARYIVASSPTGAWSGHAAHIAQWSGSAWTFVTPNLGFTTHVEDEGADYNYGGAGWVNIGASVDHAALLNLGTGNPHTQYQLGSGKDANSGYAGLDAGGLVIKPIKAVRVASDPGSPASGETWVTGPDLKFRDAQGSPATQVVERIARRNAADGYAGLNAASRIEPAQAPVKATYSTGGDQALAPADIGGVATGRSVATGAGLTGGGNLNADRTISIASFCGIVAKDFDPASASWMNGETKVHATYDVGLDGLLVPISLHLPATVDSRLATEAVFEFDDASNATMFNMSSGSAMDQDMSGISNFLSQDGGSLVAQNNGRCVRKIILQTRNTSADSIGSINIGVFRIRAWALPRGGGSAL